MRYNKDYSFECCCFALYLVHEYSSTTEANLKRKNSKPLHFVLHYGNLGGVGLGCQYRLLNKLHVEVLGGMEASGYVVWSSPYTGHRFNIQGRIKIYPWPFVYPCASWYYGSFGLTKNLDE